MKVKWLWFLILSASCVSAQSLTGGPGGILTSPAAENQHILVANVPTPQGLVSLNCNIDLFGASTYKWIWQCSAGTISVNSLSYGVDLSGTLTLTCAGGGRVHPTTCTHYFTGSFIDNSNVTHTFVIYSTSGSNNPPSYVQALTFY